MIPATAAIATPQPLASAAARDILQQGGNAFDAAVAAMLTLCVVQSHQVGLGGYGGVLVAQLGGSGKMVALDFDSRAPLAFDRSLYKTPADWDIGFLSISVPAIVAGLDLALRTYGTMPWSEVTRPAIHHAEKGFIVDPATARFLLAWQQKTDPASLPALFPDARIPQTGDVWVQKDLGRVLRVMAAHGPRAFYEGEIARAIARHIEAKGGLLSERDMADCQARPVEPLGAHYRGHTVCTPPPPSGGITTLQILKVMEHFDLARLKPWSAEYFHILAQAARLCWMDRIGALGDPDVIDIPFERLLSDESAQEKAARIVRGPLVSAGATRPDRPCTANVSIVDRYRNVVSMTATQGMVFGSQVVIPGTGLMLNHGMSRFDFGDAHHPNAPRPGKRMHHNMVPTILLKDGRPRAAFGMPGGTKIITVVAQFVMDLVDFRTSAKDTIFAPRIHAEAGDDAIGVSAEVSEQTIADLQKLGHKVIRGQTAGGPSTGIAGNAGVVLLDETAQQLEAAAQVSDNAAIVMS